MTLLIWVTFLLGSLTVDLTHSSALLNFLYLTLVTVSLPSIGKFCSCCLSHFPLIFPQTQEGMPHVAYDDSRREWDGLRDHFREMFRGSVSSNLVLLWLLHNFVSGSRLELMYISLIVNIRSNVTYIHGFMPLVLLS